MKIINPYDYETLVGIDSDVLARLTKLARPFLDDPNSVLRRELGLHGDVGQARAAAIVSANGVKSPAQEAGRKDRPRPPRAPKGSLTPEAAFERPLLQALAEAGGALPFRDAVATVGARMERVLNDHDRFTDEKGVARWEKRVPFVRLRLVERGLLDRDAPRGIWQLTDAGRAALAQWAADETADETTE